MSATPPCPLCEAANSLAFPAASDPQTAYFRCQHCELIWMGFTSRLSPEEELAHYDRHENDPADTRYREFLNRLWRPLKEKLPRGASGLDYGSGPGPTLHLMAEEDSFSCTLYDPFFNPDESVFDHSYDFITCSETAEHFYHPAAEFTRLAQLLKPGGWLGVMTTRYTDAIDFDRWHYRHDPTHVAFYTDRSFEIIAERNNFQSPQFVSKSVVLLQKR